MMMVSFYLIVGIISILLLVLIGDERLVPVEVA
jgi:hypothetical protein